MDSLIAAAARALAGGDALTALKHVSLRDDPPALALRGIAMAQLGEYSRARELLRAAARGFGPHEAVARARCAVAAAEVSLAMRDLAPPRMLPAAIAALESHGDHANAAHARLVSARRLLLLGRLGDVAALLDTLDGRALPPALAAVAALMSAEIALRSLRIDAARAALDGAHEAAARSHVPALAAEVGEAAATLDRPAARLIEAGRETTLRLADVATLMDSGALIVDACRHGVRVREAWRPLARRPVLFALVRALAEHWPGDVDRDTLIARAFRMRRPDETHRARLRVEIGRLRALLAPVARIDATARGFVLVPRDADRVALLAPPVDGEPGALLALLGDGAAWSTSALALALDASQRTVQRELAALEAAGRVRAIGRGRAQRWLAAPLAGFTTILLLPAALPGA